MALYRNVRIYMHLKETTVTHEHSLTRTAFVHSFRKRVERGEWKRLEGKKIGFGGFLEGC